MEERTRFESALRTAKRIGTKRGDIRTALASCGSGAIMSQRFLQLHAWLLLVTANTVIAFCGFDAAYRLMVRINQSTAYRCLSSASVSDIARAIAAGRRWCYLSGGKCLPTALAAVCLLKKKGFDGRLCIGVKKYPFGAHAWAICEEHIIDFPSGQ